MDVAAAVTAVAEHGEAFRSRLGHGDVANLHKAQALFMLSVFVPALLYYGFLLGGDAEPRFPATISWTVRRGSPRYVQNALWLAGWAHMAAVVASVGDAAAACFLLVMVVTGIVAVMACPVGVDAGRDKFHFAGAFFYMADHLVLLVFMGVQRDYCWGFLLAFGAFVATTVQLGKLRTAWGLGMPSDASCDYTALRSKKLGALPRAARRKVFVLELQEMVYENALFIVFIRGMCSGVPL